MKAIYSTVATCRRNLFINEFGYICSGGGSGTSDYYDKSFVGSDSKWHFLYTVEYKDEPYYDSDKIISDREKSEGLTAEIKKGKTADWKKLDYELTH